MTKTIKGSMEYMLWQLRKIKPDTYIILYTGIDCVTIRMCERNWTKW